MATFILVFAGFGVLHWLYESAIAPSLRMQIRFKLFGLRDELRELKFKEGSRFDGDAFDLMNECVNSRIRCVPEVDFFFLLALNKRVKYNRSFSDEVNRRREIVSRCKIQDAYRIMNRIFELENENARVNNGAWGIYLVPIAIISFYTQRIMRLIQNFAFAPRSDIQEISILQRV